MVQLVTCEEFNTKLAFSADHLNTTKLLFEGEGANVREDLYERHEPKWKDCAFLIATNIESHSKVGKALDAEAVKPLLSRATVVYFTQQFLGGTRESFPYTKIELAVALQLLHKYPRLLVDGMEALDAEDGEHLLDLNDLRVRRVHEEREAKRDRAFEEVLDQLADLHPEEEECPFKTPRNDSDDDEADEIPAQQNN